MCPAEQFVLLFFFFRKGRSVESASSKLFDFVYKELGSGKYIATLLLDLSKAFNSVNKDILSDKLQTIIGIRGKLHECIMSYLQNRTLRAKCNDTQSEIFDIHLGVLQGSILGPLLFLIYINDLPDFINNGFTIMYADDTTISVTATNPEKLLNRIKTVLDEMSSWCDGNKLMLIENKTVFLNFNLRRSITIPGITLSECFKILGTLVNSNLSWEQHVYYLCTKLNQAYFALHQLRDTLKEIGLTNVYYALAYSHMSLNICIWGQSSYVKRVFVLQERILQLIFNLNYTEIYESTFINKKILTVSCIYIYKCLIYAKNNIMYIIHVTETFQQFLYIEQRLL